MLLFEQAIEIINEVAKPVATELIDLEYSLNRVLAEDVYSDMDMPPFDKSAVDGYACRRSDLEMELTELEVIAAGKLPKFEITQGKCSKLMTGGMLPCGADIVIMVEDTEVTPEGKIRFTGSHTTSNFSCKAEDIRQGDRVLSKGTRIRPQEIAVLASVGRYKPLVSKQLQVGIISTGDELVEPDQTPALSQIRNSNGWQLIGQAQAAGCAAHYYGIARDTESDTLQIISEATNHSDLVLLTGGISAGDFDFVPAVIEQAGFEIKFRSLAVQPGKPVIFAVKAGKYLFALPGNPVSSFVQFEMLVKHLINRLSCSVAAPLEVMLPMGADYTRKKAGRKGFIPVSITPEGTVVPVEYHGSAHIHAYIPANGIVTIPQGTFELKTGTKVNVRLV